VKSISNLAEESELELKERTIDRVRTFLKAHQPKTAMR
jgi:hypothetical protein